MARSRLLSAVLFLPFALAATALAGAPVGWRTDGCSVYPDAQPPLAWARDKSVAWSVKTPAWGNAMPVLIGDRLFIGAEPFMLLCLNAADGSVVWQASHDYLELRPEAEREQAKKDADQAQAIRKEVAGLEGQMNKAKRELGEKTKPKDPPVEPDEATKARIEELKKQIADLEPKLAEKRAALKPLAAHLVPNTHGTCGYSSCTPVSDGQRVFAMFGNGVAAGYDLSGKRLWIREVERPTHEWGNCASPVLADGKLIIHVNRLHALDASTGQPLWTAPASQRWGSPAVAKLGDTEVVILADGSFVRARDGVVLTKVPAGLEFNGPVVADGVVYFIQNGGKAFRLPAQAEEKMKLEPLWTTTPHRERYYAGPVVAGGLIYAIQQQGLFSIIDAADGKVVKEVKLPLGGGTVYPSIVLAGQHLLVSSDNGTTLVLKPGRDAEVVGTNKFEPFRATPLCAGKRLFIRAMQNLYCLTE